MNYPRNGIKQMKIKKQGSELPVMNNPTNQVKADNLQYKTRFVRILYSMIPKMILKYLKAMMGTVHSHTINFLILVSQFLSELIFDTTFAHHE